MRRLRVLITGPVPPPPGGIASVIETIVESELADRFDFVRFGTTPTLFTPRNVLHRGLNSALARGFGLDGVISLESRAKLAAYRALLDPAPDLVHIHSSHGYDFWLGAWMARIARRRGIPALLHVHGLFDVVVPTWSRAKQAAFRRALLLPNAIVVLSEGWRRWFAQHLPPERLEVLRNPVDMSRFRPGAGRAQDGLVRFLFVGVNEPRRKGGYDILAATSTVVREAPEARFVFVGEDTERLEATRVRGTPLASYFSFTGSKNTREISPYFEQADVLLLPSYSEGLPIALLEGMAAGLPVIACPVNGIPEAMRDPEHGIFVAPGDPPALARAMLALLRDPERRARCGAAGRLRIARDFDRSHYVRTLGDIYQRALGAPASPDDRSHTPKG